MTTSIIETKHQKNVRERNEAVIKRYHELMAVEGQMKTPVIYQIMEEFNICSNKTIYSILSKE